MEDLIDKYKQDFELEILQEEIILKKYLKDEQEVVIPQGVTIIAENAFRYNKTIEIITIPESVTKINKMAFADCKKLNCIFFNAINCQDLTKDDVPFIDCVRFSDHYITKKYYELFFSEKPTTLYKVIIGKQVKRIPNYLFYNSNITSLEFAEDCVCQVIGAYAFYNCDFLKIIRLPNSLLQVETEGFGNHSSWDIYYNGNMADLLKVTFYDYGANPINRFNVFYLNNEPLESLDLVLDETITSIPKKACSSWKFLNSVTIKGQVAEIGESAFAYCENLKKIIFPSSLKTIGSHAFESCESLTEIELPNGLTLLKERAFSSCYNLPKITLPIGVTELNESAFSICSKMAKIDILGDITTIKESCFYACTGLKEITLPNTIKKIETLAFWSCENLTINFNGTKKEWKKIKKVRHWNKDCKIQLNFLKK